MYLDVGLDMSITIQGDGGSLIKGSANLMPITIYRVFDTVFSGSVSTPTINFLIDILTPALNLFINSVLTNGIDLNQIITSRLGADVNQ